MNKIFLFFALLLFSTPAFCQVENHDVRVGNKSYREKDYDNAEKAYRKALSKREESFYGNYNLGNALFRKEDWQTARKYYQSALQFAGDKQQKADALHNLGCTYLQEKQYKESIDALQKSLIERPESEETRNLLAYAMRMLKQQQNQQPPPNSGDKKQKDEMSQEMAKQILESLDQDEEQKKPNTGKVSLPKNW